MHERRCVLVRNPPFCARQLALRLSEITRRTVSQTQHTFRVQMLSMSGTVLCGPRAILLADVSGMPVSTDGGESPRREPQERSVL